MKRACVIGEGAWGNAFATLLAQNGFTVSLWCYNEAVYNDILHNRCNNRYLPGISLDKKIVPTLSQEEAVQGACYIFEAVPVQHLRSVLKTFKPFVKADQPWIVLSKGFEQTTLLFPSQIIDEVVGSPVNKAVLVGPSFAQELAKQQPTGVTLATAEHDFGATLGHSLANRYFKPYLSLDMPGAQAASAFKNLLALAIGMLDGAGYADNTRAYFFTLGLQEIGFLVEALGGQRATIYTLAGLGDAVLTSMGSKSRNREVGRRLGSGEPLNTILATLNGVPESLNTLKALQQLQQKHELKIPLLMSLHDTVFGAAKIEFLIDNLLQYHP